MKYAKREDYINIADEYNQKNGRQTILLEPRKFCDKAILGVVETNGGMRIAYSRTKFVLGLMKSNGWTSDEAVEWYEYKTLRALPYMESEGLSPLMVED